MVLYQILLTNNTQLIDLQLSGGRYKIKTMGVNYQGGAGNNDVFNVQFQAPIFLMKGSRYNNNFNATPIQFLSYGVPTTNTQLSNPMEFICDYFGSFQLVVFDLSTNLPVAANHFTSCIINLDITPHNPNRDHLE
jgi:hypothetical protein